MAKENKSIYAILGCLGKREWMTGYDIKQIMQKMSAMYWAENNAQIYPLLKKLLIEKMVELKEDSEGPRKKLLYKITPKGMNHLMKRLVKPPQELAKHKDGYLLKFSLGQFLDQNELQNHIENLLVKVKVKKNILIDGEQRIRKEHEGRKDCFYICSIYEYGILLSEAKMKWCESILKKIKNGDFQTNENLK